MNYREYLKTYRWQSKREAKLIEANFRCQKCRRRSRLQVHHLSYKRLGCELLSDLQVLCEGCHEKEHQLFPVYIDDWQIPQKPRKNAKPLRERPIHPLFKYVKPLRDGIIG